MIGASVKKRTKIVPLFVFMSQKEVLHLLTAEVNLVLIVAFDRLSLIHRIIQGQQELFKALHYGRGRTQIHVMNIAEPNRIEIRFISLWASYFKKLVLNLKAMHNCKSQALIPSLTLPEWGCHGEAA